MLGELALLYNSKRTASIKANELCELWSIDRENFMNVVKKIVLGGASSIRPILDKIKVFDYLKPE